MYTPHSLTWYEATKSGTTTTWTRHEVTPVMWQASEIASSNQQGVTSTDRASVYVPASSGSYAFKKGDVLVKGIVSDVISSSFTISALMAKYSTWVKIRQADYKDYGSPSMHHWELRGGV
jgi:exosome complex RNA-binding protein Rrp4